MRSFLALCVLAVPGQAWEFSATPVCTVTHATAAAAVTMTYDPGRPAPYAIAFALTGAVWPGAPVFGIRFEGAAGLTITTTRQRLSNRAATLTVADTGFANVLNGLEFNQSAVAFSGGTEVRLPLDGAAPAIRAFRACASDGLV